MKLTPTLEAEIKQVLETYWDSYFAGDLDTWASFLPDNYKNIGSTEEEIWNSKQEIVDYTRKVSDQMVGMASFQNKKVDITPIEPYFMAHELGDLYINAEGSWVFYAKFRLSSLLEKTADGWQILHQHGSYPDSKVEEGETFAFEKISKENQELREAVKRRTHELEQKNRELEIEATVERVRAEAMAMQRTEDLSKVTEALLQQLNKLNIKGLTGTSIYLVDDNDIVSVWDISSPGSISDPGSYAFNYDAKKYPVLGGWLEPWRNSDQQYFDLDFPKEALLKGVEEFKDILPEMAVLLKNAIDSGELTHQWGSVGRLSNGILGVDLTSPPTLDTKSIVTKMAGAFNLAYQRFLDLQKAEAQAREAKVEAALERVRAQTMAMHSSEDVGKCIVKMFSELTALGVPESTRFGIGILNHDNENNQLWTATKDGEEVNMHIGNLDMTLHPLLKSAYKAWKEQVPLHRYILEGEDLINYYQILNDAPGYPLRVTIDTLPEKQFHYGFVFDHGFFYAFSPSEFQSDLIQTTQRFSSLFGQTYRRYLDLIKAEAQAREAQIEAALERVRSRSLAMHKTSEIQEVIHTVHEELLKLNMSIQGGSFIVINNDIDSELVCWGAGGTANTSELIQVPHFGMPFCTNMIKGIKQGPGFFTEEFTQQEKKEYFTELFKHRPWSELSGEQQNETLNSEGGYTRSCCVAEHTSIFIINQSGRKFSDEENNILKRFSKVFEQTYTRFLDLQKAEAQAREAQIEAALERVRARTMAMQHSDELAEASFLLDSQVRALGIRTRGCAFNIYGHGESTEWFSSEGGTIPTYKTPRENIFLLYHQIGQTAAEIHIKEFTGEACRAHYDYLETIPIMGDAITHLKQIGAIPERQIDHVVYFKYGYLLFVTLEQVPDAHNIFKRFAKVFEQTYARFLDLQKAEAQARESRIEAALERVRSRSLAMHKTDELQKAVRVLAEELKNTGVILDTWGAVICTYFQDSKDVLHWTAAEDPANPSVAFLLPYFKDELYDEAWDSKNRGDSYFAKVFSYEVKNAFFEHAFEHSDYRQLPDDYKQMILQSDTHGIAWAWAKNSAIMIASIQGTLPSEEEKEILIRFARVFEQAYIRFLDLQLKEEQARKLAEEKQRLEKTLHDLRVTQAQLIQSEKMASLGELTAGIAHEIQNPLNFVNNYAEVNVELLEELIAEGGRDDGEKDERLIEELVSDLRDNEAKILLHGKRADAIVRGMLQHSRASSGTKEPTNLNALADEYLRLAYHGLRAKDSSFQADFSTDFDEKLPLVEVVPQDMGRVLLNIINNAFQAVHEKAQSGIGGYEPRVIVKTELTANSQLLIAITDNGSGIPEVIKDKIFQPFFTTKDTGKGTGLGLSLAYDLVKSHGGEIKVNSEIESGTEFTLTLPI